MSRNHGHQVPVKGVPHGGPGPGNFTRGPHPGLLEEMRMVGHRQLPPHPALMEEQLADQHADIQTLLIDNQRLSATHVALKQELEAAQFDLQRTDHYARALHAEKDIQLRELFEKGVKVERDLSEIDAMRANLMQVKADIKELNSAKQELTAQAQAMTQDLTRMTQDLQQIPAIKAEIEGLKQELQRASAAIEYEKKGYADNYEHGKLMENKLLTINREVEKLRAEMANAEKRALTASAIGNPGGNYNANYGNTESGYSGHAYPSGYGINPQYPIHPSGGEGYPQYGGGGGNYGGYDAQRAQRPR